MCVCVHACARARVCVCVYVCVIVCMCVCVRSEFQMSLRSVLEVAGCVDVFKVNIVCVRLTLCFQTSITGGLMYGCV